MKKTNIYRSYLSLLFLFIPPSLFGVLLILYWDNPQLGITKSFPYLPLQFWILVFSGIIATLGGVKDWMFHRYVLDMKISQKERDAEAQALGLGGMPMFILMWIAMLSSNPSSYLIPILLVLIYTIVMICYDEFVFHRKRCGKTENLYHRMLVLGNGVAWLAWFHFIYC